MNRAKNSLRVSTNVTTSKETQRAKTLKHQFPFASLFLSALSLSLILSTLLTGTLVPGVASGNTQGTVGTTLNSLGHLVLLDLPNSQVGGFDGQDGGDVRGLVDLGDVGLGVTLLGSVGLAGQEDQALLVGSEAGNVDSEALLADVLATVVDGDADGASQRSGNTSLL